MSSLRFVTLTWLLACALAATAQAQTQDRVRFSNGAGQPQGVLVDGQVNGDFVNDRRYRSPDVGRFFSGLFPVVVLDNFER